MKSEKKKSPELTKSSKTPRYMGFPEALNRSSLTFH